MHGKSILHSCKEAEMEITLKLIQDGFFDDVLCDAAK